jgi:hypothetical protein
MSENELREEIESCFSDWENDFDVDIEQEYVYDGREYFSVIVTHKRLGPKHGYGFTARVGKYVCEVEYTEDCWEGITSGSLFSSMWFDEVTPKEAK